MKVHIVAIGTSGNQRYIFASNKRRENVGASHLITRVEGAWLDAALRHIGVADRRGRIEEQPVEIVTANAGGITALAQDHETGRALVREVTRLALRDAPGLDVCGAVGEPVEWGEATDLAAALRRTRERLPVARMSRPGPQLRFPGLPIVARCGASGSPAQRMWPPAGRRDERGAGSNAAVAPGKGTPASGADERPGPRSAASTAKLGAFQDALARLVTELGIASPGKESHEGARWKLGTVVDHLADRAEWVAVVHADGNGMGEVFRRFDSIMKRVGNTTAREYVDGLRALSEGIDWCARTAVRTVVRELKTPCRACRHADEAGDGTDRPRRAARCRLTVDGEAAVLPLVLGGDDLTVLCDGAVALPFAERYLAEFARQAAKHAHVGVLLREAELPGLGACAGVAIVKRHYPFHSAADLAEELTREAKRVKTRLGRDRCALSFHVLYDSAAADLDRLRGGMRSADGARLTAQPYVVGGDDRSGARGQRETADRDGSGASAGWEYGRHWSDLRRRVAALARTDMRGERGLPGGQAHDLRAGLFIGREVADARFSLLLSRLEDPVIEAGLVGDRGSLFWSDGESDVTGLLDAMAAAPFLTRHALRAPADDGGPPDDARGGPQDIGGAAGHDGAAGHGGAAGHDSAAGHGGAAGHDSAAGHDGGGTEARG